MSGWVVYRHERTCFSESLTAVLYGDTNLPRVCDTYEEAAAMAERFNDALARAGYTGTARATYVVKEFDHDRDQVTLGNRRWVR